MDDYPLFVGEDDTDDDPGACPSCGRIIGHDSDCPENYSDDVHLEE